MIVKSCISFRNNLLYELRTKICLRPVDQGNLFKCRHSKQKLQSISTPLTPRNCQFHVGSSYEY
ncbi:hypothetical protein KSF78_0002553 [Schistosoma japonicum]|nr:hypothetical protein KSF78_0002553 [Schistosoma japonicum]